MANLMTLLLYGFLVVLGLICLGTAVVLLSWLAEVASGWLRKYRRWRALRQFSSWRR